MTRTSLVLLIIFGLGWTQEILAVHIDDLSMVKAARFIKPPQALEISAKGHRIESRMIGPETVPGPRLSEQRIGHIAALQFVIAGDDQLAQTPAAARFEIVDVHSQNLLRPAQPKDDEQDEASSGHWPLDLTFRRA